MEHKNLLKVVAVLSVVAASLYAGMIIPPHLTEVGRQNDFKAYMAREERAMTGLRKIQNARVERTIGWVKAKNLPDAEQRRIISLEVHKGGDEFNATFSTDYKVPFNLKALIER